MGIASDKGFISAIIGVILLAFFLHGLVASRPSPKWPGVEGPITSIAFGVVAHYLGAGAILICILLPLALWIFGAAASERSTRTFLISLVIFFAVIIMLLNVH